MGTVVGIDLGTTNSLVGVWRNGAPVLIPNALGEVMTPSVVSLSEKGEVLVGMAARERLVTHPARTAAAFKRYMGTDRAMDLGDREFRPEELSALVLGSLRADAEAFLGETVREAVITVPAYFNDVQRKATRQAGELAGLKVERLLTEPTAAALAYGVAAGADDELILVVDLGGGTFDVSVVHAFEGVMEVRAAAGDSWLGGEDFVDAIAGAFRAEAGMTAPSLSELAELRRQAEMAMRRLSDADEAELVVNETGRVLKWSLTRDRFEAISEPTLARVRAPIERALRDARVRPEDLTRVIMAGGASRMPMIRRLIARLFRRMPLQQINPDEVVARGAAVRAGLAMRAVDLEEAVMIDVTPFTLGIEVMNRTPAGGYIAGVFCPVIERNTVAPASRVTGVVTTEDGQKELRISVFQGESRFVKDNVSLGNLTIGVPAAPAGKQGVEVRLTVDTSGLLEVEAKAVETGVIESLVIEGAPGALTPEQLAERLTTLAALKVHPREDTANAALLARAKRIYEQRLGAPRELIGQALVAFSSALEAQEPDNLRLAREALERVVERYDDDVFS